MVRLTLFDFQIKIGIKSTGRKKANDHIPIGAQTKGNNTGRDLIRAAITQALQREASVYMCLPALPIFEQNKSRNNQNGEKS